ncbi:MAG: RNA polymerase sigma factor [Streptosporangiaceae bacterium]
MSAEPGGMPSGEGRLPGVGGPADHHPYDEYVTPLFDYCQELLGSPAAAADAVRETLISAEAQVGNVREPGLLPVWLYYLARQQCQELRPEGLPEMAVPMAVLATLGSTADADATDTAEISRNGIEKYGRRMEALIAATTALAWLPPRDREVLSLAFRHGLDAEDLAAVLGIAGFRAQVLLSAAAGRFDKAAAVTATIARADQIDCPGLGAVFGDWQPAMPALTPSLRKRLVRHIDICRICAQGREGLSLSPELLSAVPMAGPAAAAAQQISSAYDPALGTYRRQRAESAAARTAAARTAPARTAAAATAAAATAAAGMAAVGAAGAGVAAAELVPARPRAAAGRPRVLLASGVAAAVLLGAGAAAWEFQLHPGLAQDVTAAGLAPAPRTHSASAPALAPASAAMRRHQGRHQPVPGISTLFPGSGGGLATMPPVPDPYPTSPGSGGSTPTPSPSLSHSRSPSPSPSPSRTQSKSPSPSPSPTSTSPSPSPSPTSTSPTPTPSSSPTA